MDHNYRANMGGDNGNGSRAPRRPGFSASYPVADPEPLPDGHELFTLGNVLISPHVGGATSAALPRIVRLLRDQFVRISRGEEPRNIVLRT